MSTSELRGPLDNEAEIEMDEENVYDNRRKRRPQPTNPIWGWSSSGRIIVPAIGLGEDKHSIEEVPQLQIQFPKPGYHTVQFNLVQRRPALTDSILNPLVVRAGAEILWSVAGNTVRRVINVTDGMSLSGTGESATINMFDDSFFDALTDAEYEYECSVQVTPGQRPNLAGSQPPIKNAEVGFYGVGGDFAAGGQFIIINPAVAPFLDHRTNIFIPQNCGINSYHLNIATANPAGLTPVGGQIFVTQSAGSPGVAQPIGAVNYDSLNEWNPLSPGCKIITISNRYEVTVAPTLIGFILFGVDG
jgi:hypothetical protein